MTAMELRAAISLLKIVISVRTNQNTRLANLFEANNLREIYPIYEVNVMTAGIRLNPSRIDRIAAATSIDEATHMGLLDKIIDWFKHGIKRHAIEQLYNTISAVKSDNGTSVHERLQAFMELRHLVEPEHRDKFKFEFFSYEDANHGADRLGCEFAIAGKSIYRNFDISTHEDLEKRDLFFSEQIKINIEDSFRSKNVESALEALKQVIDHHAKVQSQTSQEDTLEADNRLMSKIKVLTDICRTMPEDTKEMVLSNIYGDFGYRIRSLLEFAQSAANSAAGTKHLPFPNFSDVSDEEKEHAPASYRLMEKKLEKTNQILGTPAALLEIMDGFEFAFDDKVDIQDPNSGLSAGSRFNDSLCQDIKSHNELTQTEFDAFKGIGFPPEILRCK